MANIKGENTRLSEGSESFFDLFCQPCSEENKHLEACGYCIDCQEYLCTECYNSHRRPRPTRHHMLLQKDKMPTHTPTTKPNATTDICTIQCDKHPNEMIKYRCQKHDVVVCNVCVALAHISCDKEYIPDISQSVVNDDALKRLRVRINNMTKQADAINERTKQNLKSIEDIYSDALKQVRKLRRDINETIDELESTIAAKADSFKAADSDNMQSISQTCFSIQSELGAVKDQLDSLQNSNQTNNLFVKRHLAKDKLNELHKKLESLDNGTSVTYYTFETSDKVLDFVKDGSVYGTLCQKRNDRRDSKRFTATHIKDIDIKLKSEELSTITDIVILPEQLLVLIDNDNRKLKVYDIEHYTLKSTCTLPGNPWDATKTGPNSLALTLSERESLLCLRIDDDIEVVRNIKTSGVCAGVAFSNAQYFVSLLGPPRLEILRQDGEILQRIVFDKNINCIPNYVITNEDDILVSDSGTNMVSIFSRQGELKTEYKSDSIVEALDMAADGSGSIFVCGCKSNNIHMVSRKGNFRQILLSLKDGIKKPQSVAYCEKTGRLFVSQEKNQILRIFQVMQG